jgi:hypothetical protein
METNSHAKCCEILLTAGSFFWVVHFPCIALIAFLGLFWDMDYFSFGSHLYGKGP